MSTAIAGRVHRFETLAIDATMTRPERCEPVVEIGAIRLEDSMLRALLAA